METGPCVSMVIALPARCTTRSALDAIHHLTRSLYHASLLLWLAIARTLGRYTR